MKDYLEIHNSTEHDGSIVYSKDDDIVIYLSERIDRKKHSNNFRELENFFYKHNDKYIKIPKDQLVYRPQQKIHHHLAHAACSFFSSKFDHAAILIVDGMGTYKNNQQASTSIWMGEGNKIKLLSINPEPDFSYNSLGHLYSAVTYYCGFDVWQEGKTMGLAPYGKKGEIYKNFKKLIQYSGKGGYRFDADFIGYCFSLKYPDEKFFNKYIRNVGFYYKKYSKIFGEIRKQNEDLKQNHKDLALAVQLVLEEVLLLLTDSLYQKTKVSNLCLGGGVALNSVANTKVLDSGYFKSVYIPPVCGDDGQALGKLLYNKYVRDNNLKNWSLDNAYFGTKYTDLDIKSALKNYKAVINFSSHDKQSLIKKATGILQKGKIIGWFQGRSEIGPRALGHRSILADPRNTEMKDIINLRIKHRESFRPFAPSVLEEKAKDYFDLTVSSPFMLYVCKAKPIAIKTMPAIIHVDNTARLHTVTKKREGIYYELIKNFYKSTGVPAILNTSFNNNGEPIVETPIDAIKCFLNLDLDVLVLDKYLIYKK